MLATLSAAAAAGSAVIDWPAFISGLATVIGAVVTYLI